LFSSISHDACVELRQGRWFLEVEQGLLKGFVVVSETELVQFRACSSKPPALVHAKGDTIMKPTVRPLLLLVLIAAGLLLTLSFGQNRKERNASSTTPTVLFVCEHGAAKSVIAAAYFDKLAKHRGLDYKAAFRGVNPDAALNAAAAKGLKEDGIDIAGWKPALVAQKDVDEASRVVTLGCTLPAGISKASKETDWNNVPSPSQNYEYARDDIKKRVQKLVDDLAREKESAGGKKQ
jgi:arsenate reductase